MKLCWTLCETGVWFCNCLQVLECSWSIVRRYSSLEFLMQQITPHFNNIFVSHCIQWALIACAYISAVTPVSANRVLGGFSLSTYSTLSYRLKQCCDLSGAFCYEMMGNALLCDLHVNAQHKGYLTVNWHIVLHCLINDKPPVATYRKA